MGASPESVAWKWQELLWALAYVLFGIYWPEQQQQKNFNTVNGRLSRPQANDRYNLKNYSVN